MTTLLLCHTDNSLLLVLASTSVTHGCSCEFAAVSRYVSEMVQDSAKVTMVNGSLIL